MALTQTRPTAKTERFELRLSADMARDLVAAAAALGVTRSQFALDAVEERASHVLARADATLMDAQTFDRMMSSLETPDPMPRLKAHLADAVPYRVR
ncbi:type II toxin -antitoxin system TacA 1-like antitoxin [Nocardioides bruguierae]|uniref:DUF1778 domain-containing protein n=1 Tax=Nocardioides bruguierae TaxID=2945102 RepID=A0A9X2DB33_9ACTN|nr:DUF1778 domain-containing protein [Nocardioides bruguierae]MCM0622339.1 DUF1778 domain-containing protein [Nocardioides bruguierae]